MLENIVEILKDYLLEGYAGVTLYFEKTYFFGILFICIILLFILNLKKEPRGFNKKSFIISSLFAFYILSVISIVFFPIKIYNQELINPLKESEIIPAIYYQLIPFETIYQEVVDFRAMVFATQIIGNILLLAPIAVFLGLLGKKINLFNVIIIGFFTSLFVESTQLGLNYLFEYPNFVFDVDDIILNTLGVIIGYIAYKLLFEKKEGQQELMVDRN